MVTKSISLSDDEAAGLRAYLEASGEDEPDALKRAAMRGLEAMRLERGILAFREGRGSSEGAEIAGVPRAEFLQILIDRGEKLLTGPSTLPEQLAYLAEQRGDERLADIARELARSRD